MGIFLQVTVSHALKPCRASLEQPLTPTLKNPKDQQRANGLFNT